jgi:hypothetical protein
MTAKKPRTTPRATGTVVSFTVADGPNADRMLNRLLLILKYAPDVRHVKVRRRVT